MTWLGIYVAGVIVALVLHGLYGNWQDDGLAIVQALIWPAFIPMAVLLAPIKISRFIADNGHLIFASTIEARRAETPQSGSVEDESVSDAQKGSS